jgi:hypothetical protein
MIEPAFWIETVRNTRIAQHPGYALRQLRRTGGWIAHPVQHIRETAKVMDRTWPRGRRNRRQRLVMVRRDYHNRVWLRRQPTRHPGEKVPGRAVVDHDGRCTVRNE